MTYKYYDVRQDIYETCSDKKLKGFRTWSEIKKLFKTFHWIMFTILILSLISVIVIWLCPISNLWNFIPMSIIFLCTIIVEYKFNPLLDEDARKSEMEKQNIVYNEYIDQIKDVLNKHGIDNDTKRQLLKKECISSLEKHESKYAVANVKVFDSLIGVPIGALISSLIYKNRDALISKIIAIIIIGLICIGFVNLFKKVSFYSDGYLKDKQMLNTLQEVEYSLK